MDNVGFSLFETSASEVSLPGEINKQVDIDKSTSSNTDGLNKDINNVLNSMSNLMSDDIGSAIEGEVVKSVLIPEDTDIMLPNYVIDLTDIETVDNIQIKAIDALINDDGDTGVYICIKGGLQKVGMGYNQVLNRILSVAMLNVFSGKCRVYRNYVVNQQAEVVDSKDIVSLRLSI